MAITAQGTAKLDKLSREQILSVEFWIKIEKTISLFKPICDWIRKIEGDESAISDIPYMFHDLEKHLIHDLFEEDLPILKYDGSLKVKNLLQERKTLLLKPIHCAASILDPKYNGKSLDGHEFEVGQVYIGNLAKKLGIDQTLVLMDLMEYIADEGIWKANHIKESAKLGKPITWWKGMCSKSVLHEIAVAVLQLPCTSAATERSFSMGWIHNSKRNALGNSNASKITYMSYNTKLLDRAPRADKFREQHEEAELLDLLSLGELEESCEKSKIEEDFDDFIDDSQGNARSEVAQDPNVIEKSLSFFDIAHLPVDII